MKRRGARRGLGLALVWAGAGALWAAPVPGYRGAGTVSTIVMRESVLSSNQAPFLVEVVGPSWRIVVGDPDQGKTEIRREIASDGVDVIEVLRGVGIGTNLLPATVHRDGCPGLGHYPDIVWLAYASEAFLRQGRALPAPWLSVRHDRRALSFQPVVTTNQQPPAVPTRVDFLSRGPRALLSTGEPFKAASYQVTDWTNLGEWKLPARFELTVFATPQASLRGKPTNLSSIIVVGSVTQMSACAQAPGWPALQGVASVSDRRFQSPSRRIDSLRYYVTNQWVLDMKDPRLESLFSTRKKQAPWMPANSGWALVGIVILGLAPLSSWWFLRRWRKRT